MGVTAVVVAAALVVGGVLDMVHAGSGLAELDDEVAEWGSAHASSTAVDVLKLITLLGGTTVVIVALAAAGVVAFARHRDLEIPMLLVAVVIAVAVATSRALLGVHWLTDIVAGLVLGWGLVRARAAGVQDAGAHSVRAPGRTLKRN